MALRKGKYSRNREAKYITLRGVFGDANFLSDDEVREIVIYTAGLREYQNKGQVEAAKALGLNKVQIFLRVMGPQIIRHALPGIGNVWQITLKDTSLISVTGLVEIMRQTRIASNVEHSPLTFLITAAFLYLFLTTFSGKFFKVLEVNYSKGYN